MRYYIISGEPSGDLHGSRLIRALRKLDAEADVRAWGGEEMEAEGAVLAKHYRELAFMGIVDVVKNLPTILGNVRFCKRDITAYRPDRLILIDYSGFNLRIARWAAKQHLDVSYYISPQVWAWRSGRVNTIRKTVDRMLVILPFEEAWYAQRGVKAHFVGHPLLDIVREKRASSPQGASLPGTQVHGFKDEEQGGGKHRKSDGPEEHPRKLTIAILPGSRTQEITVGLPIMLAAAARLPEHHYVVAAAPGQELSFYDELVAGAEHPPNLVVRKGATYDILAAADAAVVTSGTATLEAALFGVPQVVCYRGGTINYAIAKRLVGSRVKYISLVNLIMDAPVVTELVQADFTLHKLTDALGAILSGPARQQQLADLKLLRQRLGSGGAAGRAAKLIVAGRTTPQS